MHCARNCSTIRERGPMPSPQQAAPDYFTIRGLAPTAPETLNAALRQGLDAMPTMLYG